MRYSIVLIGFLLTFLPLHTQNVDIRLLRAIHTSAPLSTDHYEQFLSNTYPIITLGAPITMVLAGYTLHDDKLLQNALELSSATVLNLGFTALLKFSANRQRPYVTYPDIQAKSLENSPSFPSYHTSAAFNTASTLSLMYPKWYVIVPSYLWAGSVGYSRMYLGVHYPSDVLCGALLGIGSAWLNHEIGKWYREKSTIKHGKYE